MIYTELHYFKGYDFFIRWLRICYFVIPYLTIMKLITNAVLGKYIK